MEIIYLLIPISLLLLGLIAWIMFWAVRDGQFDDLEGPGHRILMDEDKIVGDDDKGEVDGNEVDKNDADVSESRQPEQAKK